MIFFELNQIKLELTDKLIKHIVLDEFVISYEN